MSLAATAPLEVIRGAHTAALMLQRTRRELLGLLAEPNSAAGLARRLGYPRQRVNYHLRELEREGLVECIEQRRKGNCTERILRATARSFVISPEALGAMGVSPQTAGDRVSAAYLIAAAAQTLREVSELAARARSEGKRLATLTLDSEIRFASAAARAAFAEELTAALASLVARYHDDHAPGGRTFRLVSMIHPGLRAASLAPAAGPIEKTDKPRGRKPPAQKPRPAVAKAPARSRRRSRARELASEGGHQ